MCHHQRTNWALRPEFFSLWLSLGLRTNEVALLADVFGNWNMYHPRFRLLRVGYGKQMLVDNLTMIDYLNVDISSAALKQRSRRERSNLTSSCRIITYHKMLTQILWLQVSHVQNNSLQLMFMNIFKPLLLFSLHTKCGERKEN